MNALNNLWSTVPQQPMVVSDATRVAVPAPPPDPPASDHGQITLQLQNAWLGTIATPADHTAVAPPHPRRSATLPTPPQEEIGPADPQTVPAEESASPSQQACDLDPLAAEVNGYRDFGTGQQSNWQKVGASPLEMASLVASPNVFAAPLAAKSSVDAIRNPSALNIGKAALSVAAPFGSEMGTAGEVLEKADMGVDLLELNSPNEKH